MRPGAVEFYNYIADGARAHRRQALALCGLDHHRRLPESLGSDADSAGLHVKTVLESKRGFSSD